MSNILMSTQYKFADHAVPCVRRKAKTATAGKPLSACPDSVCTGGNTNDQNRFATGESERGGIR